MSRNTISIEVYKDAFEYCHWVEKRQLLLLFTGQEAKRHSRTEKVLRRLSKRGKIRAVKYGKKLVYAMPRKTKNFDEFEGLSKVYHGLACTECLVRTYRSRMESEIIAERFFYGCGSVPEWGIRYSSGSMILLEFATKSNFLFSGLMNGKLNAYRRNLEKIERKFQAEAVVLFVIDAPRVTVERYVGSLDGKSARSAALRDGGDGFPLDPFFFTDYKTFLSVPLGDQLKAYIYFWIDGKEYPLSKDV